jgi:oligopeptide transport system permease protein
MGGSTRESLMAAERAHLGGGFWQRAAQRLWRKPRALLAGGLLLAIALLAIAGPQLAAVHYDALDWNALGVPPQWSGAHWLGTDRLGRDLFVRTLVGVRISLLIGVLASAVSLVIGVVWGMVAGYSGGRTDEFMMRVVDVLYSLPYLFVVIILTTLFTRGSLVVLLVAIGAVGWLTIARIVRGETLHLARSEFVEAARAIGVGPMAMLWRHIMPNLSGTIVAYATLAIPQMILFESFLSFLGLGVQEPLPSLGNLINDGAREMQSAAWMLLVPAGFLLLVLLCLSVLGDALRDALDPRDASA